MIDEDRYRCDDCQGDWRILRSAPMVHDDIWRATGCHPDQLLCDGCFRLRMRRLLGRTLRFEDLTVCPFNMMTRHHQELTSPGKQRADYEDGVCAGIRRTDTHDASVR